MKTSKPKADPKSDLAMMGIWQNSWNIKKHGFFFENQLHTAFFAKLKISTKKHAFS